MPRVIPPQELDQLVALISYAPQGADIDALSHKLGGTVARRTLQRRLAQLVAQQRIRMHGEGRAIRYHIATPPGASAGLAVRIPSPPQGTMPVYVHTSAEGEEVRANVAQPRHLRRPVGYRLEFLEQYHPNHTAYLPQNLREQLHSIGRPPEDQALAGTFARDIFNRLLIDLSWASSRLEGNTYSRLDTERLIQYGKKAKGKNALETQMILNHKQAIEYLVLDHQNARVDTGTVLTLHALLADDLMADPTAVGCIRRRAVGIGGSVYMPIALPQRLEELFGIVVSMAADIKDPFEQAFFLMVHLPYLQPFEDVNKRVSRLAANIPFIRHNLCPLSFIDVPAQAYVEAMIGVYELNRIELLRDVFVWAYERSCQQYVAVQRNLVQPDIFRLRHRQDLGKVIAAIVRQDKAATRRTVKSMMPASMARADHDRFVELVLTEFKSLHEGNCVRFGIRPLALAAWQRRHLGGK